jgi:hypothetical protein
MKNLVYYFIYIILSSVTLITFLRESWVTFFLTLITILAIFILRLFFKKSSVIYPKEIEIAFVIFIISSLLINDFAFANSASSTALEVIMHIISGALFSLIAFVLVYALNNFHKMSLRLSPFFITLFAFTFSITFSFLWIIAENIIEELVINGSLYNDYIIQQVLAVSGVMTGSLLIALAGYQYLLKGENNLVGRLLERFFSTNLIKQSKLKTSLADTLAIIKSGENDSLEFKSTLRINLHTGKKDKKIERASLKTVCAFLNSSGGILLIGVEDNENILGIKADQFANNDKFQLHFSNLFKQQIGEQFSSLIQTEIIEIEDKFIYRIDCFRSQSPVFLNDNGQEEFFIRLGAATQELQGSKLIEYIKKNF